jgi:phage I-like protein
MNRKNLLHFAVAACTYSLGDLAAGSNEIILQLTPAGDFRAVDGRPYKIPAWNIDAAAATQVINRFNARKLPIVIDYEHQTLHKETNGQPAPAAAWIRELMWREGEGLFARAELTEKARSAIQNKEYLYFSPVFRYDGKTGQVLELEMGAITNTPAVHGMNALELRAAATFGYQSNNEDPSMNKLLLALIAALGLPATASEDEAVTALNQKLSVDPLKKLRDALGQPATASEDALVAACTSLKTANPDPVNYVPIAVLNDARGQVVALTKQLAERDAADTEAVLQAALTDGRVTKGADEDAMRELAKTNPELFKKSVEARAPIAALTQSQTKGQPPEDAGNKAELTADEIAVCTQTGMSHEEFKKSKLEMSAG